MSWEELEAFACNAAKSINSEGGFNGYSMDGYQGTVEPVLNVEATTVAYNVFFRSTQSWVYLNVSPGYGRCW